MARAQVCRFYDDGTSGAALRRPIKRLPEFQNSTGLFYSAKARRTSTSPHLLHVPRSAVLQIAFVLAALLLFLAAHSPSVMQTAASETARTNGAQVLNRLGLGGLNVGEQVASTVRVNVPQGLIKDGVSLTAVCMGRHETLKKTVPAWLSVEDVDEIVLVDWSSEPPLEDVVRQIDGGDRVKIIRVEGEDTWVLSRAYNLAINSTSYSNVIRTDCDYEVGKGFVSAHAELIRQAEKRSAVTTAKGEASGKHYYAGNYNLARDENEVHLNGAVFIRRKDFLDVGGYDERIQTYGWDDEDLYNRLGEAGLKKRNISYDHVSHVKHGNAGRAQSGVKFASVEIDLNSLLLEKLKPWSRGTQMKSTYDSDVFPAPSSNRIIVRAATKPKSLKDLVSSTEYEEAWAEALGRRLHDSYKVPWDIIAAMDMKPKESLLRRLMQRTENREKAKRIELDAAGRQGQIVDVDSLPIPRVLLCHCMHGLGNRLRALGSCMSFAKETSRELVVVWEPDSHIEAKFTDMFNTPLVILEKMPVHWPFSEVEKWDSVWSDFKYHNYMEMEGDGAVKGEIIHDLPNKHMYYKGAYIMEVENSALTNWEKDNNQLRSLTPIDDVTKMVAEMESKGLGSERVVGLHVRNRTLSQDIKNVDFLREYGDEATRTMDMWRHKSGVHNFMTVMNRLLKENPATKFFVATDTFEVIGELEGKYGPERILSFTRTCDERDGHCVKYALADLYALSKCKVLYGSNWSSFTEAAERLGGVKAKLAGQDFGI
ncbi:unnamed protein product [Agarophyton chilense]|eukprot:gb/GEZJ01002366.1/.p1 GENE.gb/GEZJ01002366.1/~~gb/GEZJ01002366.1/.p1  ORF type:complete len:765 (-),score=100.44 gb/GEZJ01002366.1/:266-2560(-)